MKKIKSKLAIILMMMLIVTSFEFVGVFAEGEDGDAPAAAPAATEETTDAEVEAEAPVVTEEEAIEPEGVVDEAAPEAEEEAPAITNQEGDYNIKYTAAAGGTVTNPEDNCPASEIQGSTATPDDGYSFAGWFFNDATEAFSTEKTLTADAVLAQLNGAASGSFRAEFSVNKIAIQGLKSLSGYKRVYLRWKNPAPADDVTYTVTCNGKPVNVTVIKRADNEQYDPGYYQCAVTGLDPYINCNTGKYPTYSFTVTATSKSDPSITKTASKSDHPVRTIAYKIKIKKTSTLTSHYGPDGKKNASKKFKVKKGQYIYAYGYGFGGKYVFRDPRGYVFFCNLTRTRNRSCVYTTKFNYSNDEATLFVNDSGVTSKNNSLVWVNTYTQHIYLFKRVNGKWVLNGVSDECSTGKASSPSPTVQNGMKSVEGYIKKRHGIPYWTKYSGINAIHAKKAKWKMGKPASNGCVRNYEKNAKKVFQNTRKGSRVFLY